MVTVLIELPGGGGVVRREDGRVVVTQDVADERGQPLRDGASYLPVKAWMPDDRTLVGGLLPPGAVTAEVLDDRGARVRAAVGDGAYAAVLEQPIDGHDPVVCCRDGAGAPVRRPLPGSYPCQPVLDAEEPCPACGALDWEQCVPTESWRGGTPGPDGRTIPGPIVVCRVCGHEERVGSLMRFASPEGEDEAARAERIARWRRERRVQKWYTDKITLLAATFPIYAAEGRPAQISGSGSHGDELTELTIAHTETEGADLLDERPGIEVTTSIEERDDELTLARRKLEQLVHEEIDHTQPPDPSDAAIALWFRAVDRLRRAAALDAAPSERLITIDGAPEPFLTLTTPGGRWVAVRRHYELTVTIASSGGEPAEIMLEPIADPEARLLGPEPEEP